MFTALAFGLCALILEHPGAPFAAIGYITDSGTCEYKLVLPDNGPQQTPPIEIKKAEPHRFAVRIIPGGGAVVFVDDLSFELPRGERI